MEKKNYFKPGIMVKELDGEALMEYASVHGEEPDPSGGDDPAKEYTGSTPTVWTDDEE